MVSVVATDFQPTAPVSHHATMHGIDANRLNSSPKTEDVQIRDTQKVSNSNMEQKDLENIVEKLNDVAKKSDISISFVYNEKLNRSIISVIDQNSGKVIRKLPSDEAIKFAESVKDQLGKLFDRKG